jgi:N-acyl homoserine lactone hydrolase
LTFTFHLSTHSLWVFVMAVQKMVILPNGFLTLDRSVLLTGVDIGKKIKASVFSVLLFHDEGPVLIDAGLNPDGLTDPSRAWGPRAKLINPELSAADDLRCRLREFSLKITDIKKVILTHLHWDHTGSLRFFTHCPIVVQRAEYRFAFHPDSFVASQYMSNHFSSALHYDLVEGDRQILPGISVIHTPGHTPGHQSIIVRLGSGASFIFPGDTIGLQENLTLKIPASNNWSSEKALQSIHRLENLAQLLDAEIIPSHDFGKWESLKKSPEYYL